MERFSTCQSEHDRGSPPGNRQCWHDSRMALHLVAICLSQALDEILQQAVTSRRHTLTQSACKCSRAGPSLTGGQGGDSGSRDLWGLLLGREATSHMGEIKSKRSLPVDSWLPLASGGCRTPHPAPRVGTIVTPPCYRAEMESFRLGMQCTTAPSCSYRTHSQPCARPVLTSRHTGVQSSTSTPHGLPRTLCQAQKFPPETRDARASHTQMPGGVSLPEVLPEVLPPVSRHSQTEPSRWQRLAKAVLGGVGAGVLAVALVGRCSSLSWGGVC